MAPAPGPARKLQDRHAQANREAVPLPANGKPSPMRGPRPRVKTSPTLRTRSHQDLGREHASLIVAGDRALAVAGRSGGAAERGTAERGAAERGAAERGAAERGAAEGGAAEGGAGDQAGRPRAGPSLVTMSVRIWT